jgi:hypothetical protein
MEYIWNPIFHSVILHIKSNDAKIYTHDSGTHNPLIKPSTERNTRYGFQETFPCQYLSQKWRQLTTRRLLLPNTARPLKNGRYLEKCVLRIVDAMHYRNLRQHHNDLIISRDNAYCQKLSSLYSIYGSYYKEVYTICHVNGFDMTWLFLNHNL